MWLSCKIMLAIVSSLYLCKTSLYGPNLDVHITLRYCRLVQYRHLLFRNGHNSKYTCVHHHGGRRETLFFQESAEYLTHGGVFIC